MTATHIDGRKARGDARRRVLIAAALSVLERDGVASVTHRAVATEAGVPLASASYHFDGIDDLVLAALLKGNDDLVTELRERDDAASLRALAAFLASDLAARRPLYYAYYELYLLAARRPELRAATMEWLAALTDHYAPAADGTTRDALHATIDGLCMHAVVRDQAPDAGQIEAMLRPGWPV